MPSTTATFRTNALRVLMIQAITLLGLWLLQWHYTA